MIHPEDTHFLHISSSYRYHLSLTQLLYELSTHVRLRLLCPFIDCLSGCTTCELHILRLGEEMIVPRRGNIFVE